MKKIFIVSPFESELEKRGFRNIAIAKAVSEFYDVTLLTSNFSHQRKQNFPTELLSNSNSAYTTVYFRTSGYKKNISAKRAIVHILLAFKILSYLVCSARRGDIVLVASIPVEIFSVVSLLRLVGVKIVLDVRDIWPDALSISSHLKRSVFRLYCSFWYLIARAPVSVMYTAPSFARKKNYFKDVSDWSFIPIGYDASRWSKIGSKTCSGSLRIAYVGSLELQCPLDELINAVNHCENVELWIMGDGSERRRYEGMSNESVKFFGLVDPKNVPILLADCDLGYLPFRGASALPNKFFDYLAAGLPIITAGAHDAAEIVVNEKLGWSANFDSDELENLIKNLQLNDIETCRSTILQYASKRSSDLLYLDVLRLLKKLDG